MKILSVILFFAISLTLSAKKEVSQLKDKITLGDQEISIAKAEIIINKMPSIGPAKNRNYIIVTLQTSDKKKIRAKYSLESLSFLANAKKASSKVKEKRGDGCVVRGIPDWAAKGTLVALSIKDSKGVIHKLKAKATALEVH